MKNYKIFKGEIYEFRVDSHGDLNIYKGINKELITENIDGSLGALEEAVVFALKQKNKFLRNLKK